ncbi:hypothetical protein [Paenibacillus koleovorans]|uniref:hypothetical protein n=1 Tax=Paenibacillus koleovorans TaxID=121608 RepID=UPI000FD8049E|nr:hypothetical protein [Paenibacillus koleovorans]
MKLSIVQAAMTYSKGEGYLGRVHFTVETHAKPYEITLFSKKGQEWEYALLFLNESGNEEQITAVEDWLEEDDEAFDQLVQASLNSLPR